MGEAIAVIVLMSWPLSGIVTSAWSISKDNQRFKFEDVVGGAIFGWVLPAILLGLWLGRKGHRP